MKTILSLDISSSTIGWSIIKYDDNTVTLMDYNHLKPLNKKKSKDCLPKRLNDATDKLKAILQKYKPDEVIIEDYAKRFSKGKSKASIIIMLALFNEICCLTVYNELEKEPIKYAVASIRSEIGKLFNEKIVSKDEVYPCMIKNCKVFLTKTNKKGTTLKESMDECDAICVGLTHILKISKSPKTWNI